MIHPGRYASFHCHFAKESVHTCNDGRIVGGGQSGLSGNFIFGICTHFVKKKAAF